MRRKRSEPEYDDNYDDQYDEQYDDEYDDDQDDSSYDDEYEDEFVDSDAYDGIGVTPKSMSKARNYWIVAMLFLFLVVGGSAIIFIMMKSQTDGYRTNCWIYEQTIESMVSNYVTKNGLSANPAYIEDIPGIAGNSYSCKAGGSYTWNPVSGTYECSEHGHFPADFQAPQSQVVSSTKTEVVEKSEE